MRFCSSLLFATLQPSRRTTKDIHGSLHVNMYASMCVERVRYMAPFFIGISKTSNLAAVKTYTHNRRQGTCSRPTSGPDFRPAFYLAAEVAK